MIVVCLKFPFNKKTTSLLSQNMFADQALNTYSINHIEKTLKMQILSTSPPPAPLYAYNVLHLQSDIFASLNHL